MKKNSIQLIALLLMICQIVDLATAPFFGPSFSCTEPRGISVIAVKGFPQEALGVAAESFSKILPDQPTLGIHYRNLERIFSLSNVVGDARTLCHVLIGMTLGFPSMDSAVFALREKNVERLSLSQGTERIFRYQLIRLFDTTEKLALPFALVVSVNDVYEPDDDEMAKSGDQHLYLLRRALLSLWLLPDEDYRFKLDDSSGKPKLLIQNRNKRLENYGAFPFWDFFRKNQRQWLQEFLVTYWEANPPTHEAQKLLEASVMLADFYTRLTASESPVRFHGINTREQAQSRIDFSFRNAAKQGQLPELLWIEMSAEQRLAYDAVQGILTEFPPQLWARFFGAIQEIVEIAAKRKRKWRSDTRFIEIDIDSLGFEGAWLAFGRSGLSLNALNLSATRKGPPHADIPNQSKVVVHPSRRWLAWPGAKGDIVLWDRKTGKETHYDDREKFEHEVYFDIDDASDSPSEKIEDYFERDTPIEESLDINEKEQEELGRKYVQHRMDEVKAVYWSPDGLKLISISSHRTIVWAFDPETGELTYQDELGSVYKLGKHSFSPNGHLLATQRGLDIVVWRIPKTGRLEEYQTLSTAHHDLEGVYSSYEWRGYDIYAFTAENELAATSIRYGDSPVIAYVEVFNLDAGTTRCALRLKSEKGSDLGNQREFLGMQTLIFRRDGKLLAGAARDHVQLWDWDTMSGISKPKQRLFHRNVGQAIFSPDGHVLVTASKWERGVAHTIGFWALNKEGQYELIGEQKSSMQGTVSLSFNSDGSLLYCDGYDGASEEWEVPALESLTDTPSASISASPQELKRAA